MPRAGPPLHAADTEAVVDPACRPGLLGLGRVLGRRGLGGIGRELPALDVQLLSELRVDQDRMLPEPSEGVRVGVERTQAGRRLLHHLPYRVAPHALGAFEVESVLVGIAARGPHVRHREAIRVVEDRRASFQPEEAAVHVMDEAAVLVEDAQRVAGLFPRLGRVAEDREDVVEESRFGGFLQHAADVLQHRALLDQVEHALVSALEPPHDEAAARLVHEFETLPIEIRGRPRHRAIADVEAGFQNRVSELLETFSRDHHVAEAEVGDARGRVVFEFLDHVRNAVEPIGQPVRLVVRAERTAAPEAAAAGHHREDGCGGVVTAQIEVGEVRMAQRVELALERRHVGTGAASAAPAQPRHVLGALRPFEEPRQRPLSVSRHDEVDHVAEVEDQLLGIVEEEGPAEDHRARRALLDDPGQADPHPELLVVTDGDSHRVGIPREESVGQLLEDHGHRLVVPVDGLEPLDQQPRVRREELDHAIRVLQVSVGAVVELVLIAAAEEGLGFRGQRDLGQGIALEERRGLLADRLEDLLVIEQVQVDHPRRPGGQRVVQVALERGDAERRRERRGEGRIGEDEPLGRVTHGASASGSSPAGGAVGRPLSPLAVSKIL